jgi:hypothetical protein
MRLSSARVGKVLDFLLEMIGLRECQEDGRIPLLWIIERCYRGLGAYVEI